MNRYHMVAIQMKYEGKSYEQISKFLQYVIKPDTVRSWFFKGGKLYHDYLIYEEQQNQEFLDSARREVRKIFSQNAGRAAQAIVDVFNKAIEDKQPHLIIKYADMILSHADVNIKDGGEEKELPPGNINVNITTYEQFVDQFRKLGGLIQSGPAQPVIEGDEVRKSES